jgi:hypothetical protein
MITEFLNELFNKVPQPAWLSRVSFNRVLFALAVVLFSFVLLFGIFPLIDFSLPSDFE